MCLRKHSPLVAMQHQDTSFWWKRTCFTWKSSSQSRVIIGFMVGALVVLIVGAAAWFMVEAPHHNIFRLVLAYCCCNKNSWHHAAGLKNRGMHHGASSPVFCLSKTGAQNVSGAPWLNDPIAVLNHVLIFEFLLVFLQNRIVCQFKGHLSEGSEK